MRWIMGIFALLLPSVLLAHPLPANYCDNNTVLSQCMSVCKQGATGPFASREVAFKRCFDRCIYAVDCASLKRALPQTLFSLKNASDTPQIVGVWVGVIHFSSNRGLALEPAEFTITANDNGSLGGALLVRKSDATWYPIMPEFFDRIYGVLTPTSTGVWSVSLGYIAGEIIGTYTTGVLPADDKFVLEVTCTQAVNFPPQFSFQCPFSATVQLTRQ